jgi:hypothetical protein
LPTNAGQFAFNGGSRGILMKLKSLFAAFAAMAFAGAASAVATPGQSLGSLSAYPALYGSFTSPAVAGSFLDGYKFKLDAVSDVTGSVGVLFGNVSFSKIWIDGLSVAPTATPTGYGFSFGGVTAGVEHTLKVEGTIGAGFNGYTGSVYAIPAVPEPESLALALAGLGIVGVVSRRRRLG